MNHVKSGEMTYETTVLSNQKSSDWTARVSASRSSEDSPAVESTAAWKVHVYSLSDLLERLK